MATIIPSNLFSQGKSWKAMAVSLIAALGFGLGSGVVYGINQNSQPTNVNSSQSNTEDSDVQHRPTFTLSEYNRIKIGMSQEKVELILRPGVEESRTDSQTVFSWKNLDGSYIRVSFKDGKVLSKKQDGLIYRC